MSIGRLSWIGIAAAGGGWLVLIFGDAAMSKARLWADPVYVVGIGQGLILTGIGLAVIDALHAGFGALNRFFEAVLQRSAARTPPPEPARAGGSAAGQSPPRTQPMNEPEIIERGRINDRAFLLYGDGSVEVETLLGVRRFETMNEARAFIGS